MTVKFALTPVVSENSKQSYTLKNNLFLKFITISNILLEITLNGINHNPVPKLLAALLDIVFGHEVTLLQFELSSGFKSGELRDQ